MSKKFYVVTSMAFGHSTLEDAIKEAEDIAQNNIGSNVFIMEPIKCYTARIVLTESPIENEEPEVQN